MRVNKNNLGKYHVPSDAVGGICIDIGANVGNFFDQNAHMFSCIHYYEPVDENWEYCQEKKNKNVTGFKEAVLGDDGVDVVMAIHKSGDSGSCRVNTDHEDWIRTVDYVVKSVSFETVINRILKETGKTEVDYIKMDCECSEYDILMGKDLSIIRYIGMEIHNQLGKDMYTDLWNYLSETHEPSVKCNYRHGRNQEVLWKRRS